MTREIIQADELTWNETGIESGDEPMTLASATLTIPDDWDIYILDYAQVGMESTIDNDGTDGTTNVAIRIIIESRVHGAIPVGVADEILSISAEHSHTSSGQDVEEVSNKSAVQNVYLYGGEAVDITFDVRLTDTINDGTDINVNGSGGGGVVLRGIA